MTPTYDSVYSQLPKINTLNAVQFSGFNSYPYFPPQRQMQFVVIYPTHGQLLEDGVCQLTLRVGYYRVFAQDIYFLPPGPIIQRNKLEYGSPEIIQELV